MAQEAMEPTQQENNQERIASGINIILGIWLVIASFVLGYSGIAAAMWNEIIVGVAIIILAWLRVSDRIRMPWLSWVNVVLGLWLIVAPFVLGYSGTAAAMWNEVIIGIAVAILGAWSALAAQRAMA